jgi:hypothetical protein
LSASFNGNICDTPGGDVIVGTEALVDDFVLNESKRKSCRRNEKNTTTMKIDLLDDDDGDKSKNHTICFMCNLC